MLVVTLKLRFHIPWATSLKDKRMVVKSLCAKMRAKFGVSVAEVEEQDTHQTAVLGIACVGTATDHLDSTIDHIIVWVENNCEAELVGMEREFR